MSPTRRGTSLIATNRWGWSKVRAAILMRDGFRCQVCGDPASEVDHVVERQHGGGDDPRFLRAICKPCHAARRVKPATVRALFKLYGVPIPPELEQGPSEPLPGGPLRGDLTRR